MTTDTTPAPRPAAAPPAAVLSEARNVRLARSAFHFLSAEMSELKPMRVQLSVATDTYESLDDMVDLIRAKLAPGTLTLWAVDSIEEDTGGITICITGNNEKGEDHAKWIATMWANMPLVLNHMDSLLTTVRVQQESIDAQAATIARLREALQLIADEHPADLYTATRIAQNTLAALTAAQPAPGSDDHADKDG